MVERPVIGEPGKTSRRRWVVGFGAIGVAVVLVVVAGLYSGILRPQVSGPRTSPSTSSDLPSSSSPPQPTALRCAAVPAGPAAAPEGAVSVATDADLAALVRSNPAGTTYWLAPGEHRLGTGEFDQVVPQDGDTFLGGPGAVLDGQRKNKYAFGGTAKDVTIRFLTVQNFGVKGGNNNEGVVNHDSSAGWKIESSLIQRNAGAGMMIGSRNRIVDNCLRDNGQYGFNAYNADDVSDVTLEGNEVSGNNTDDWEKRQPGCGCTGGGKFWATSGAKVTGNYVHDNRGVGLWADSNNNGFLFERNYIADNDAEGLFYEISYNAAILDNTFVRNALAKGVGNPTFPTSAIYLSESGSDPRVDSQYKNEFRIAGNLFLDNWSGIVAWENADRFAGSPANTSSGLGTLVNPKVATVEACGNKQDIKEKPYFDDCRWKTQNLVIEDNVFSLDASKISRCVRTTGCGFNGVFSNYGTYPAWSPYKKRIVSENITFHQNNVWRDNTYIGEWHFMVEEPGKTVSWDAWRGAPYNQDASSTLR